MFGTVEMRPPTVGTWMVECTIGDYQLAGMRAKLLVYNPSRYTCHICLKDIACKVKWVAICIKQLIQ